MAFSNRYQMGDEFTELKMFETLYLQGWDTTIYATLAKDALMAPSARAGPSTDQTGSKEGYAKVPKLKLHKSHLLKIFESF